MTQVLLFILIVLIVKLTNLSLRRLTLKILRKKFLRWFQFIFFYVMLLQCNTFFHA